MRKKLLTLLGIMLPLLANAYSFVSNGIYYRITSEGNRTVEVTYKRLVSGYPDDDPTGTFPPDAYHIYVDWSDEYGYPYTYIQNDYNSNTIEIPSSVTYNNVTYQVISIGSCAFIGSKATTITIPNTVTTIQSSAFEECSNLQSLAIPSSVTSIGGEAFKNCSSMESLTIPSSVTTIGDYAFRGCTGTVTLGSSRVLHYETTHTNDQDQEYTVHHYPFQRSAFKEIILTGSIPNGDRYSSVFESCSNLESVTIESYSSRAENSIGDYAFHDCRKLSSINLQTKIDYIGNHAFDNCSSLSSISISGIYATIGEGAFNGCTKLNDISFGSAYVNNVTPNTFPAGSTVHIIEGLKDMCENSGNWNNYNVIDDLELPYNYILYTTLRGNKIDTKGSRYNYGAAGLLVHKYTNGIGILEFNFPVTSLYMYDFEYCHFNEVWLPNSIERINEFAFSRCRFLQKIHLPSNLTYIERDAFGLCESLTTIDIPDGVTYIGNAAFGCTPLVTVTIPSSVRTLCAGIFTSCNDLVSINLPESIESIEEEAFHWCSSLTSINFYPTTSGRKRVNAKNGVHLTSSLTSIGASAFNGCASLTSIEIPEGIENILEETFANCSSLTEIIIPSSVTNIGDKAFRNCVSLSSITCNATTPPTCGEDVFAGVNKQNALLYVPNGSWESYANDADWGGFRNPITTITLGASDYSTYCTNVNLDFSEVEGLKAYIASSFNPSTGSLTITRVTNVPAGEGILLKGTAGESYDVPVTSDASVVANLMKGNTTSITLDPATGEYTNFVLSQNSEGVMGFYRFNNSITMPAHKAWLQIPTSAIGSGSPAHARGFRFVEEGDEMTGIADIEENSANSDFIYDLQGRRLNSQPAHGLYIQNGKKIIK